MQELREVRRIWLHEKHEFDDSLPKIYEEATGEPFPKEEDDGRVFGGMNGSGKTTILDAIQLALYGPRARCSKRTNLSYEAFLRQAVHQGAAREEGAEVSVSFR